MAQEHVLEGRIVDPVEAFLRVDLFTVVDRVEAVPEKPPRGVENKYL